MPFQSTVPEAASVDPTSPPISACEDEEGSPEYQATRVQVIAQITPAKTMPRVEPPGGSSTRPEPTVLATSAPKCAPMKLPIAAMPSATLGVSARVEMLVAIAFAASWNPLV